MVPATQFLTVRASVLTLAVVASFPGTDVTTLGLIMVIMGTLRILMYITPWPPLALATIQPTAILVVALVAAGMVTTGMVPPAAGVMFLRETILSNLGPLTTTLTVPVALTEELLLTVTT